MVKHSFLYSVSQPSQSGGPEDPPLQVLARAGLTPRLYTPLLAFFL